ncbi:MAG: acyltransferase [Planctomycetaceae bacterium]|nr:acyltransferase [Planctomycetaceae bacterium]
MRPFQLATAQRKIVAGFRSLHIHYAVWRWRSRGNIAIDGSVVVAGLPLIRLHEKAHLRIGHNVTLTSVNSDYHLNMFARTKILADRPHAEIRIGENSRVHGTCLHATKSIAIGANCLIAANTQIMDSNGHEPCFGDVSRRIRSVDSGRPVVIEDNVWIGTGSVILPGTFIGFGSIIAAMSVVRGIIPPFSLVAGNPAQIVKTFSPTERFAG